MRNRGVLKLHAEIHVSDLSYTCKLCTLLLLFLIRVRKKGNLSLRD